MDSGNRVVRTVSTTVRCSDTKGRCPNFGYVDVVVTSFATMLCTFLGIRVVRLVVQYLHKSTDEDVQRDLLIPDLDYIEIPGQPESCSPGMIFSNGSRRGSEHGSGASLSDWHQPLLIGDTYNPPVLALDALSDSRKSFAQ